MLSSDSVDDNRVIVAENSLVTDRKFLGGTSADTNNCDRCTSIISSSRSSTVLSLVPDDPEQRETKEVMSADDDQEELPSSAATTAEEVATTTTGGGGGGNRVRFRVEPTTMPDAADDDDDDTPPIKDENGTISSASGTASKPAPLASSSSSNITPNIRSVLRSSGASLDHAVLDDESTSASCCLQNTNNDTSSLLSEAPSGDSMESLYNLTQILPTSSSMFNDRTLVAASFIESIPPYVTVRLPSDMQSAPSLPLSWMIRNGDHHRLNTTFPLNGPSASALVTAAAGSTITSTAAANRRNLNKSASYTAANAIAATAPIVSQAYRTQFSSRGGGLSRIHSASRQSVQWPPSTHRSSTGASSTPAGGAGLVGADAIVGDVVGQAISPVFPTLKHVQTEHVVPKHALKAKMNKYQRIMDGAFAAILAAKNNEDGEKMDALSSSADGLQQSRTSLTVGALSMVSKVFSAAWSLPSLGLDLAYGLCDYLREMGYLDILIDLYLNREELRESAGSALADCFSYPNRDYLVNSRDLLESIVAMAKTDGSHAMTRISLRLFEGLFRQDPRISARLISLSALDYVLNACKASTDEATYRHSAFALANLAMYSDHDCQQKMLEKNVPDWLFLLASSQDDITRYYACLAICTLVSNKEIEAAVTKSGTLSLVEPFLSSQKPCDIAAKDVRHRQGRRPEWLAKLVPMLNAKRREPRAMAAFHFTMEAKIKKKQERLDVLREIGAVDALKQTAALPDEIASKFASLALEIIGEKCPHKLSPQVPLWTVEDVQYWVSQIGFEPYASTFAEQKVDGDLLLLLSDDDLRNDIGISSGLHRKRFMRELDSLKMAADYGCVDETNLDRFLASVDPHFSIYTYRLLDMGIDCSVLGTLGDGVMREDCGIMNPVHRLKLLASLEECKHVEDMEVAILSKRIDIFISYRRSTGNQLASLLKVLLQLRSHKVFIDVDRLYAGQFDSSLLKNIQAAKHFVLVLTPGALDRCIGDDACNDWVHKEVRCALEHNKNVVPVLDPRFEWPEDGLLPPDMRAVTRFNAVHWVHEYQEACVMKLEKFIKGELNVNRGFYPSLPQRNRFAPAYNRSLSKPTSSSNGSATDLVLDALSSTSNRPSVGGYRPSTERLLPHPQQQQQYHHHGGDWDES